MKTRTAILKVDVWRPWRVSSPKREWGAADKAANLARRKSSYRQLPVFGRLVYPVRAEVTKHVLPGCKSLGRPVAVCAAVGTIWEASKFGGLNIMEYLQPRIAGPQKGVCEA